MVTQRLFFDCDTGIDDSLALLYLLARRDVDLVGVASTAGNVPVDVVAANNLAWLALCGRSEIPVHVGSPTPLSVPLMTTEDTHGPLGVGYAELPAATAPASPMGAADAWIDAARAHPGELVGLVTGPLTSLATAVRRDPQLPSLLRRLVIMGGAFHTHGNTTPVAEWNVAVDPEAAAEVFDAFGIGDAPAPIVCALDLTETIAMTPDHWCGWPPPRAAHRWSTQIPATNRACARWPTTPSSAISRTRCGSTSNSMISTTRGTSRTCTIPSRRLSPSPRTSSPPWGRGWRWN